MSGVVRCLIIALAALGATSASEPLAWADTVRVVAAKANVRLNPTESSPIMLALTAGTVLDEASREGNWFRDLMVDELVNGSSLRVIERKKLMELLAEQEFAASDRADVSAGEAAKIGKLLGARYLIFGSITQFSHEQGGIGGAARLPMVGGLGVKTGKAHVGISARMIDTTTGEIVASGTTKKTATRRSVTGAGAAGGYGGGLSITSSDFLDTILGEATQDAIKAATVSLLESKARVR